MPQQNQNPEQEVERTALGLAPNSSDGDVVLELRRTISARQQEVLDRIWRAYRETGKPINRRVLEVEFKGQAQLTELLKPLGGSIVSISRSSGGDPPSCRLTLLGALLSTEGETLEGALAQFLAFVRNVLRENPTKQQIQAAELLAAGGELARSTALVHLGLRLHSRYLNWGGSYGSNDWTATIPNEFDVTATPQDPRAEIRSMASAEYDPACPLEDIARLSFITSRYAEGHRNMEVETELDSRISQGEQLLQKLKQLFFMPDRSDKFVDEAARLIEAVRIWDDVNAAFILHHLPSGPTSQYGRRGSLVRQSGDDRFPDSKAHLHARIEERLRILRSIRAQLPYLPSNQSEILDRGHGKGKVFIGHGRSPVWRELKELLVERLGLDWDEFNRESPAGLPTTERLEQMLDSCEFAFLVFTGEDIQVDETRRARENVIHEAGLFQGAYGFKRAIILLEEGCAEFTNIVGLGQIRFPKGNILAMGEEIRKVLEREGVMVHPKSRP